MESKLVKSESFPLHDPLFHSKQSAEEQNAFDVLEATAEMYLKKFAEKIASVESKQNKIKRMIEQNYDPAADITMNKAAYFTSGGQDPKSDHNHLRMLDASGRDDIKFLTAKYTLLSSAGDKLGLLKSERSKYVGEQDKLFITTKVQLEELKQSLATLGDQIAVREGNIEGLKRNLKEVDTKLETVSNALSRSMASKPANSTTKSKK